MAHAVTAVEPQPNGALTIHTGLCMFCQKPGTVPDVDPGGFAAWKLGAGEFIQDALPGLTAGQREQLLNGSHDECFDAVFGPGPDDEDL